MNIDNLQSDKLSLINWITQLQDSSLIEKLKKIQSKTKNADWYDELTPKQLNSIEKGRLDVKAGRVTPHSEVQKQIRNLIESKKSA